MKNEMEIVGFILGKVYKRYVMLITICFGLTSIQAQWEFVGSPESCEPVFFDSEGDTLLVLTTGGLFYSTDKASSWLPIEIPDSVYVFEEIQIERGALFLTTKREIEARGVYDVFRSDDWGATWVLINSQLDLFEGLKQLVIKADTCYYISREIIYVSFDKGDQFTPIGPTAGEYSTYDIHHHRLYAKVSGDNRNFLLRSSNDGLTWDTLDRTTENIFISDVNSIDGVLWKIKFFDGSHYCRIEKSFDDGDTWITTGLIENLLHGFFDRSPRQILGLSGQLYVITELSGKTIYHSADGGQNWSETANISTYPDIFFSKDRLFFTSYQGFYASQDHGISLDKLTNGIEAATVEDIAVSGSSIWVASNHEIFNSSAGNSDWQHLDEFDEVKATRDGHLLATGDQNAYVSADQGQHWTEITYEDLGLDFPAVMHYAMCAGDIMYLSTSSYDLYYSTDYGVSWHLSDKTFGYSFNYNGKYLLEVDSYVLTSDNGIAWTALPKPEHPNLHFFLDFVYWMEPYYFTGSNELLLRLHKDSSTWEEMIEPFSDVSGHSVALLSHEDVLFLTVFGEGVFGSKDHGQTWYTINEGLTNFKTITLTKDYDFLYLGTEGGVWKRPLNELTVGIHDPVLAGPTKTSCLVTADHVSLNLVDAFSGNVNVLVFSADGRFLFETKTENGLVDINLSDVPSGLYYLNIWTSKGREIKRVMRF